MQTMRSQRTDFDVLNDNNRVALIEIATNGISGNIPTDGTFIASKAHDAEQ